MGQIRWERIFRLRRSRERSDTRDEAPVNSGRRFAYPRYACSSRLFTGCGRGAVGKAYGDATAPRRSAWRQGPLAFEPRLGSRELPETAGKHARLISFRPHRHGARLTKRGKRGVAVLIRTTQEEEIAHDAVVSRLWRSAIVALTA